MHSLALAEDVLQAALSEARKRGDKRIKAISVTVGNGVFDEADSLQFCLEALSKGTVAEGACIKVEVIGAPSGDLEYTNAQSCHGSDREHPEGHFAQDILSLELELD